MADISQVTLSNGNVVNIKDSAGREALATGLAGKVSIAQGVQNAGKTLQVANTGLLELVDNGSVTSIKMNNGTPIEPDSDGVVDLGTVITAHQDISSKLDASEKGANSGVATLDASGKVPSSQLPSYVDDVLEYASLANFPLTGETGKIYVAIDTGKVYRWSGSAYVNIASISVVDNLTSTSATDALSAKQGKALNDKIDAIETYSEISDTNIASGTGSSAGLVSGRRVKYALQQNLKVTNGDVQLYGEHLTGQVPAPTTANNGKILKIASGAYTLANETTELPSVSSTDNGKVLGVSNGAWAKVSAPSGLPSVTSTDNGKFLRVIEGAWAAATVDSASGVSF